MNNIHKIDVIQDKERTKITCIERKYKVEKPTFSFIITAKSELDENSTNRLLQEDMELKTFLTNYDIVDIVCPRTDIREEPIIFTKPVISPVVETESIEHDIAERVIETDNIEHDIAERVIETDNIEHEIIEPVIETIEPDMVEPVIEQKIHTSENNKRSHKKKISRSQESYRTEERRALFDYLDLPEVFTSRNYIDAIEKKGAIITNIAMPYDDLEYFERLGKVKKLGKVKQGARTWKKIIKNKKVAVKREIPIFI